MSTIKLARIFGDGAVLQRKKEIRIWGFADAGSLIAVSFAGRTSEAVADDNGRFDVVFPAMEKGGPYAIEAVSENGDRAESSDVMVGDVLLISGQSNMEFPMERVRETYPSEWDAPDDRLLRTFKVTEKGLFGKTIPDVETGEWKCLSPDTIDAFSAVGYFAAKHMRMKEDVATALVDITLGGASIEAFMSEEMLSGFDFALAEAKKLSDDVYLGRVLAENERSAAAWLAALDEKDAGVAGHYEDGEKILEEGEDIVFPDFFSDTQLDGFIGSLWIAKRFSIPREYAGKEAAVWFGTIVDFDSCYVNGVFVGNTEYTYPPRRYTIPEGVLKEGDNTLVLRIGVEKGFGRITPGKLYAIVFGKGVRETDGFNESLTGTDYMIPVAGVWKYLIGAERERVRDQVFVNWKATALWNGMLCPLKGFQVKAFAFYQGESNCMEHHIYKQLTRSFIEGLRSCWQDDVPYICVQLPEFNSRMEEITYDGGKTWRALRKVQEACTDIPGFYLVDAYGTGELNDLHPQRKEPIGEKIAETVGRLS